jgi:hypothetical protein
MEGRVSDQMVQEHTDLIIRIDRIESRVEDRIAGMTSHFLDEIRDVRDFLTKEVKDMREFFRKLFMWFAVPAFSAIAGVYLWEWQQVTTSGAQDMETAKVLSVVVEQQVGLSTRMEDMRLEAQRSSLQQDEINQLRIQALREIIQAHRHQGEGK